jgi:hypothetical protein
MNVASWVGSNTSPYDVVPDRPLRCKSGSASQIPIKREEASLLLRKQHMRRFVDENVDRFRSNREQTSSKLDLRSSTLGIAA